MRTKNSGLSGITLDDAGRAILSDDVLADVEMSFETESAGGLNGSCNNTSNGNCFNATSCVGSSNSSHCTNQTQCSGTLNPRICEGYQEVGCGQGG